MVSFLVMKTSLIDSQPTQSVISVEKCVSFIPTDNQTPLVVYPTTEALTA